MIGLLIQLAISWLLLWALRRKNLEVLGLLPNGKRIGHLITGFLLSAACCVLYHGLMTLFNKATWEVNRNFSGMDFLYSSWWSLRSVLFEELIFRGALLYLAMYYIGERKAVIVSAITFGIYHWFSFGVLGDPFGMTIVFLATGLWGYIYARAFSMTRSMYLPTGFHLGWNLFNIVVFSNGPLGAQLLLNKNAQVIEGLPSLLVLLVQLLAFPLVAFIYLKRMNRQGRSSLAAREPIPALE